MVWYDTNTIYDMNISTAYITRTHRFTCPLTLDKTTILPAVTWLLQFPGFEIGLQTLVNGGKSSYLKEKEIVAGTDCLETSLYYVSPFLNKKII